MLVLTVVSWRQNIYVLLHAWGSWSEISNWALVIASFDPLFICDISPSIRIQFAVRKVDLLW